MIGNHCCLLLLLQLCKLRGLPIKLSEKLCFTQPLPHELILSLEHYIPL